MAIFALIGGVIVGAFGLLFELQNMTLVTVQFSGAQFTAPLSALIVGVVGVSAIGTIIAFTPRLAKIDRQLSELKNQKRALETELAKYHITIPIAPPSNMSTDQFAREVVVLPR